MLEQPLQPYLAFPCGIRETTTNSSSEGARTLALHLSRTIILDISVLLLLLTTEKAMGTLVLHPPSAFLLSFLSLHDLDDAHLAADAHPLLLERLCHLPGLFVHEVRPPRRPPRVGTANSTPLRSVTK